MFNAQQALSRLVEKQSLNYSEMENLMRQIMAGEVSTELLSAILVALKMKGESIDEISAAASVMREFSSQVNVLNRENLVDIVGTGGDGAKTFNISSTAMFVAAAAGAKVAKHGGRSVSSSSGSADVFENMGVPLMLKPELTAQAIEECGIGFMFAQNHHSAMRHVAPVRKTLGFRTIFNILGPLTNPASAPNQLLGVFDADLCAKLAQVLQKLGSKHVLVVHGSDGLDEITVSGSTHIAELKNGQIHEYTIQPSDFGLTTYPHLNDLVVQNAQESLAIMNAVLRGENRGAARDIVILNAAACIYVAGVAQDLREGMILAQQAIDGGHALAKQQAFIQTTQQLFATQNQK